MMDRAHEYRRHAAECVGVARLINNPADKAMLLDMAQKWRSLAEREEAQEKREPTNA
jgi:hypothetical protein